MPVLTRTRKSVIRIVNLCLLLSCGLAQAHDNWSGRKAIESIQVLNNGGFVIYLDSEVDVLCSYVNTHALLISPYQNEVTVAGAKTMLSTALIAFSAGHSVDILYSDDTPYCWGRNLSIYRASE